MPPAIQAAVDSPDRPEADRALDAGRHPAEILAFLGVAPGMKVAELMAGGGYTSELLARVVGADGTVYGENSKFVLEKFAEKAWSERLARPGLERVVRADRELEDPLPPEAKDLDLVVAHLVYHDFYWMEADRAKMNAAIFAALAPGGQYAIIDHAAAPGAGATAVKTLHRIEESEVVKDVEAAGFVLDREGDFLRNPDDHHDWNAAPGASGDKRGTSDRFVLVFRKPA
ncbi:MAG: class I SAM-dependent methyltransferase [Kofleriaceae bacterium]|nr:class I SAM-dependent methyltransferase [Myxococcales bacterium]MCB9561917.1 class I SAM-dependent methyltransferase [Kofleriaceae bacterium]